jgi:hypothetical protein
MAKESTMEKWVRRKKTPPDSFPVFFDPLRLIPQVQPDLLPESRYPFLSRQS